MPTYHIRRTATFTEHYAVQAETEEDALEYVADDATADVVEDMGDGEYDVYQVDPDPEPEKDPEAARTRLLALVEGEVEQTAENNDAPDFADYLSDLVYRLVGELAVVVTGNDEAGVDVADAVAEAIDHATEPYRTTTED